MIWGLRDYQTEPQIWGGEADCEHEWGEIGPAHHPGQVPDNKAVHTENAKGQTSGSGQFCQKCGCWRGQLGLEPTLSLYIGHMVEIARELWRVLRRDGTMWWNHGDCYSAGKPHNYTIGGKRNNLAPSVLREPTLKPKDLVLQPHRVALALQADGWWLRSAIVWAKGLSFCPTYSGSVMPESCRDRPTSAYEMIFVFTKAGKYYYDNDAVKEQFVYPERRYNPDTSNHKTAKLAEQGLRCTPGLHDGRTQYGNPETGRNLRNVWAINPHGFAEAHFATFPEELPEPCIKAGTSEKGCCPKCGAPWHRVVAKATGGTTGRSWHDHEADWVKGNAKVQSGKDFRGYRPGQTIGWLPTCECAAARYRSGYKPYNPIPCTVLDPFSGSGTSGVVALKLGRRYIGIELSEEYTRMSLERLSCVSAGITVKEHRRGQKSLFEGS